MTTRLLTYENSNWNALVSQTAHYRTYNSSAMGKASTKPSDNQYQHQDKDRLRYIEVNMEDWL
jgi:hypothetical protein